MPLESYYVLLPKPCVLVIGKKTRRKAARNSKDEMANVEGQDNKVPPQDNQVPLLEEVAKGDEVHVVPPPMIDG